MVLSAHYTMGALPPGQTHSCFRPFEILRVLREQVQGLGVGLQHSIFGSKRTIEQVVTQTVTWEDLCCLNSTDNAQQEVRLPGGD